MHRDAIESLGRCWNKFFPRNLLHKLSACWICWPVDLPKKASAGGAHVHVGDS